MRTRTGKRTAHVKVQIVEDSAEVITMFFEGSDKPLRFTPEVRTTHFEVLANILERTEPF